MRTALLTGSALLFVAMTRPAIPAFDVVQSYDPAPNRSIQDLRLQSETGTAVAPVRRPTVPVAQGFGEGVPLAFAIRQIVPAGTRVTLAVGVDPDTPVDWRGGRAWNRVLADATANVGLRLVPVRGGWMVQP